LDLRIDLKIKNLFDCEIETSNEFRSQIKIQNN
jgi:hypothetical protein